MLQGKTISLLIKIVQSLFVMLANRLYLNLRTWKAPRPGFSTSTHDLSNMDFVDDRILGRIGAPVRTMDEDDELYDDSHSDEDSLEGLDHVDGHAQAQDTTMVPDVRR